MIAAFAWDADAPMVSLPDRRVNEIRWVYELASLRH